MPLIEQPVFNGVNYTGTAYVMDLICALQNGRDIGSGIKQFAIYGRNLLGPSLPPVLLDYNVGMQVNLYGGYPDDSDIVPSAIFLVAFTIIMILHLMIFSINYKRNHYFYHSLYWVMYSIMRILGFGLRIRWLKDITLVDLAIADEALLVLGNVALVASNLTLAQRLFSWRHPVGGQRRLFRYTMYVLYFIVAGVIAMTVVACGVPYLYYLSVTNFWRYKICNMVSSILITLYSLTAISLVGLSYFFQPTRKDENLYTYQPWWIESFHPLYFVKKGAKVEAEETFMKRNHNHRHAVRVIAATHHHYNMVEGLTNQRGDLKHNKSILIILISTSFLFIPAISRCVAVFEANANFRSSPASSKVLMYITWGLFEVIINIIYIVGRVDLRFYRPDRLPKKVRAIITAEQSITVSADSTDLEYSDNDSYLTDFEMDDENSDDPLEQEKWNKSHFNSNGITPPQYSSATDTFEDDKRDDESEFHF